MRAVTGGRAHGGTHRQERKREMGWERVGVDPLVNPWLGWGCPHGMEEIRMEGTPLGTAWIWDPCMASMSPKATAIT